MSFKASDKDAAPNTVMSAAKAGSGASAKNRNAANRRKDFTSMGIKPS